MKDWLKAFLRRWLEIEPPSGPADASISEAESTTSPPGKKPSGAFYAQMRAARAEVQTMLAECTAARLDIRERAADVAARARADNFQLDRALTDFSNTLVEVFDLHRKLEATLEAMGFAVVMGEGHATVLPLDSRALRTRRILEAREAVSELHHIVSRARQAEQLLDSRFASIAKMRSELPPVLPAQDEEVELP